MNANHWYKVTLYAGGSSLGAKELKVNIPNFGQGTYWINGISGLLDPATTINLSQGFAHIVFLFDVSGSGNFSRVNLGSPNSAGIISTYGFNTVWEDHECTTLTYDPINAVC